MRFVMPTGLFKKAIPICVAAIILNASVNTFISVRETRKSADKIESAINNESEAKASEENAPVINNNITIHGDYNNNTITDSYNTTNGDNSTEEDIIETDNNTEDEEYTEDTDDTEYPIEDDTVQERPIENDSISTRNINSKSSEWKAPTVKQKSVLNKNLECPNCGAYTYSERYNPDLLEYYFGVCSTCYSENSNPDIVKR